jgi:hypothetical protein
MEAPDYINRVAGVRIWRVAPNLWAQLGGLLWAPGMKEPWPSGSGGPEEYYASCAHPDHAPPDAGCGCGVYAFYNAALAKEGGYWPGIGGGPYNRVLAGVIGAAGDVELHDHGMKAERATVEAIFTNGADDEELPIPRGEIAAAYGAAVIDAEDFEEFCAERGLVVIDPAEL